MILVSLCSKIMEVGTCTSAGNGEVNRIQEGKLGDNFFHCMLRTYVSSAQSRDCVAHSQDPEIAFQS